MNASLKNSVAVVTGASRGIGKQIALTLGKLGVDVVLAARDVAALDAVCEEIINAGGKATSVALELTSEESIMKLAGMVEKQFGKCDILINNAGITYSGKLQDTPTDVFDKVMAINARGPFILCRELLPMLTDSKGSFVINIASVVGVKGYPMQSAYSASKHALRGMTMSLAEELHETNVRVHTICMGGVDTEMVTAVRPDINKQELIAAKEIAQTVEFLLTRDGNGVIDEIRMRRETSSPWFT